MSRCPAAGPRWPHAIRQVSPDTIVAVYTAHGDRLEPAAAMLAAGAAVFLEKGRIVDVTAALLELFGRRGRHHVAVGPASTTARTSEVQEGGLGLA